MNKKKKIVLLILLYLIGFIIQIIGTILFEKTSSDLSIIVLFSSAIFFAVFVFILSTMVSEKYRIIKYVLYFFIIGILLSFLILCIASIVTDFQITSSGGIIFG